MSRQYWYEGIGWNTVDGTAVANTTSETALFGAYRVGANFLQDGRQLVYEAWGRYSTTTGPPTFRFRLRLGGVAGVLLADSGTITTVASQTNAIWAVRVRFTVRSNGSSGTLFAMGEAVLYNATAPTVGSATGAPGIAPMGSAGITAPAAATVDFTADQDLVLTGTWSAASASNSAQGHNQYVDNPN